MYFQSVLAQLSYQGTRYDAARVSAQGGFVKRVTPILPESLDVLPDGQSAYYDDNGASASPRYSLKASFSYTYTPPTGVKVYGPGALSTPADSITSTLTTTAANPMFLVFVSNDGSEFLLNLSTPEVAGGTASAQTNSREVSVATVPCDRTLLLHLIGDAWELGTAADFEASRSENTIW